MSDFALDTTTIDDRQAVIGVVGELDLASVHELRWAIAAALDSGHHDIVLDLSDTTFLDSTALGVLISARRRTYALAGSFEILCRNPRHIRLFEMTSLDKVFRIRTE